MRKIIFHWLGKEFISLSAEATPAGSASEQTAELFRRVEASLRESGLTLENTVRTRIWGSDREARKDATAVRANILKGQSRAASSSYISAIRFDSAAKVALDLLALRPAHPGTVRQAVEFQPAGNYLRYLKEDNVVFISGFTSEANDLATQVPEIFAELDDALKAASSSRDGTEKASVFLDKRQPLESAKELLRSVGGVEPDKFEFELVDGFSREKSLMEIELTALTGI